MADRSKAAKLLEPGDRVRVFLGGLARVVSCKPSERTMVRPRRSEHVGPEAVGLIVVYELTDGPKRGVLSSDIIHPDDEVLT